MLRCGALSWGYGLPRFDVAPPVGVMDSIALVWPLKLWIWTPTLRCGPLSWELEERSCFAVFNCTTKGTETHYLYRGHNVAVQGDQMDVC